MKSTVITKKIVIVGATGLVGTEILRILESTSLEFNEIVLLASERSAGKNIIFSGQDIKVEKFDPIHFKDANWVFFSGKDGLSEDFCPVAASGGAWVIDNSAVFRMKPDIPLVVPEVNIDSVGTTPGIIANPNCSTIQLAVALAPLRDKYGLKRVIVSTYQSASGAGGDYLDTLKQESAGILNNDAEHDKSDSLAFNCLPAIGEHAENGRFTEESKLENELMKILGMDNLPVCATAVRVPTFVSHGESVVIETETPVDPLEASSVLAEFNGIEVLDDFQNRKFPTLRQAAGTDPVWVGRIRQANIFKNDLAFWVVADNLRKGAALNAVQIAEYLSLR